MEVPPIHWESCKCYLSKDIELFESPIFGFEMYLDTAKKRFLNKFINQYPSKQNQVTQIYPNQRRDKKDSPHKSLKDRGEQ